jgi:plasmid stabilization system protein ParE
MRNVRISIRAGKSLDKIIEYLEKEWSKKVKDNFIIKLDKSINQIKNFPESFVKSVSKSKVLLMEVPMN